MIKLENRTNKMMIILLDKSYASVTIKNNITVEGKDGKIRIKPTTKLVPDSLRIPAKSFTEELPEIILQNFEIKYLIAKRELRVIEINKDKIVTKQTRKKAK